jgi:hypothetical protein
MNKEGRRFIAAAVWTLVAFPFAVVWVTFRYAVPELLGKAMKRP